MSDGLTDSLGKMIHCGCFAVGKSSHTCEMHKKDEVLKQGAKFDSGKPRVDLVPPTLINGVAEILTFGAVKYAAHNWRKGIAYSRVISSLFRHLLAWVGGEQIDPESGKSHLWHAGCNIAFLIEYESKPEVYAKFDDRYKGESDV